MCKQNKKCKNRDKYYVAIYNLYLAMNGMPWEERYADYQLSSSKKEAHNKKKTMVATRKKVQFNKKQYMYI